MAITIKDVLEIFPGAKVVKVISAKVDIQPTKIKGKTPQRKMITRVDKALKAFGG